MLKQLKIGILIGALSPFTSLWAQSDFMSERDPLGALMNDIKSASERVNTPELPYESPVTRPEVVIEEVLEPLSQPLSSTHALVPQQRVEMPDFSSFARPNGELLAAKIRLIEKVMDMADPVLLPVGRPVEKHGMTFYLRGCKATYNKTSVGHIKQSRAFVDIVDAEGQHFFSGWMYNDAPGFHAPEHPNYDISFLGCEAIT
jgi:hypothetical protein